MGTEIPILVTTKIAGESLSNKRYHAVKLNSSGQIITGTAGARCVGLVQDEPASDRAGSVMNLGVSPGVLGNTVTAGDDLASDSNGHLVTAVAGDSIVGIALEGGSVTEEISVLVVPQRSSAFPSGTQGDMLYYNGSNWVVLHAGTANYLLKTGGAGANPSWTVAKGKCILSLHMNLADIADGDILTDYTPGFVGTIDKVTACVRKAATTPAKASTLTPRIGSTPLTGGVVSLTSSNMTPIGKCVDGSSVTAANSFGATDKISIAASSTTTFVEGEIDIEVVMTEQVTA